MRFAFLFPVVLLLAACNNEPTFTAGQMPECDSPYTKNLFTSAIHQSPRGQQGLKIIQLGATEDYSGATKLPPDKIDLRFCKVHAFTNAGEGDMHFTLKWMNAEKSKIWLQVTVSTI